MGFVTLLLIAVGLSFDSFAVSISCGLMVKEIKFFQAFRFAFTLALFQSLMPVFGWLLGYSIKEYVEAFGHWIAFILLVIIAIRMIFSSLKKNGREKTNPLEIKAMIGLALATSIDALVIGVGLAFLNLNILLIIFTIGAVTFIISMLGVLFGKKAGGKFGKKMEIVGAVILIIIGLKILLQHFI